MPKIREKRPRVRRRCLRCGRSFSTVIDRRVCRVFAHLELRVDHRAHMSPSSPEHQGKGRPEAERSAVVVSSQPVCAICGGRHDASKRETCSDRCRPALSRRRRAQAQASRDDGLRAILTEIGRLVQATVRRLT